MENDRLSREEIVKTYRADVERLVPYLSWLEANAGQNVSQIYEGEDLAKTSVTFPVYDSTLLKFIRTAEKTRMMDRNYVYVYTRYHLKTAGDELKAIDRAALQDMHLLSGILSKYVLKGKVKANVWQEGVRNGVLFKAILKMKELMEFWDKPLT